MKWIRKKYYWGVILILAVIVTVGTISFMWLSDSSEKAGTQTVTELSQIYLQEISAQKIGHIQTSVETQFDSLNMVVESVTGEDLQSEEELRSFLERAQSQNQFSFLALIDDDGNCHSADGVYPATSKISSFNDWVKGERMIDEPISDDDMLILGESIAPITYGDNELIAIAAGYNRENITDVLTISADNVKAHTKIYGIDGGLIAECSHEGTVDVGNNLFSGLRKYAQFGANYSLNAIEEDIQNSGEGMVVCHIKDTKYYLYYAPISGTDWYVVVELPYASMDATISTFAEALQRNAVLAVCMVIVVLLTGFLLYVIGMDRAARETEQARRQAEKASMAKSEFLSHMSHDIRTPINAIIGMTNIAQKNQDQKEKVADCIQKIKEASGHLLMLVNDVLDMSRIESGKIRISHEPLDMCSLVQSCATIINGQLMSRELDFQCEFGEFTDCYLFGDDLHLRQILINILGNAVKFTPDGGSIWFRVNEVSVHNGRACYRFVVEDTGVGMSEEFQEHIFEAFSQEDNGSRTHYAGTGLGMAITKQFIDLMGGIIQVESQILKGSRFTVDITFDIDSERHAAAAPKTEKHTNLSDMRVLLVEDNELNMEIAQELLEEEGVTVSVAMNGQEAVDCFLQAPAGAFDVILMDVMMPVLNGYDATRAIRASEHPDGATIPIIAMTANAYEEDVQDALAAGMNAHVAKPIEIDKFFTLLGQFKKI